MNVKRLKLFMDQVDNPTALVIQLALYKVLAKTFRTSHNVFRWIIPIRYEGFKSKYVFQIMKQLSPEDKEFYTILRNPKYKRLIDVGSSIGAVTDYFLRQSPDRKAICFEPKRSFVEFSRKHLPENIVIPIALSDVGGNAYLYYNDKYDQKSSIVDKRKNKTVVNVAILDNYNFKPDLIKIDVEGNEYRVIKGALKTINKYRPDIIFENNDGKIKQIKKLLPNYKIRFVSIVAGAEKDGTLRNYFAEYEK